MLKQLFKNENAIAIGLITITQFIFFHEQIFGISNFWSGYWSDITEFTASYIQLNSDALAQGSIPYWNPYSYGGMPHLAEPTTGFFYPLNFIGALLINLGLSVFSWMTFTTIFHYWFMQVGMYYLLKYYKLDLAPALFGSIAFSLSTCMISTFMIPNFLYTYAFLPWLILVFNRLLTKKTLSYSILMGLIVALMFLGGNPNILFFIILFLFFYFAYWVYKSWIGDKKKSIKTVTGLLALSVLFFVLLSVAQLSEMIDFLPYSKRQDITYNYASDGSLKWGQLMSIIHPNIFGKFGEGLRENIYWMTPGKFYHYWETAFYFGVITWLFSFVGFYNYRKKRIMKVGFFSIVFFVLFALGDNGPIFKLLFNNVPGFNLYRIPARALFIPVFIFSIAGAFGLQKLTTSKSWNKKIWIPLLVALILFAMALLGMHNYPAIPEANAAFVSKYIRIAALLLGLVLLCILALRRNTANRSIIAFGCCILLFVDLNIANKSYKNSESTPEDAYLLDKSNLAQLYPDLPQEIFRIGPKSNRYRLLRRNGGIHMKLFNMDGLYGIQRKSAAVKGTPVSDLLSKKYHIAHQENNGRVTGYGLEQISTVFPYARMIYDFEVFDERPEDLTDFSFGTKVALSTTFEGLNSINKGGSPEHTLEIEAYDLNRREISVTTAQAGILSLAEHYYPGWKAYINGEKAELLQLNFFQQGIFIPSGTNEVMVVYKKPMLSFLIILYFMTLIGIMAYFAINYIRRLRAT